MERAHCAGDIRGLQVWFGQVGPGSAQCTEHLPAQLSVRPTPRSSSLSVGFVYPVSLCLLFSLRRPLLPTTHFVEVYSCL